MKNRMNNSIWIILIIFFSTVFLSIAINETHGQLGDGEFLFKRGNDYLSQHQYDHAISDYTRALDINPSMAEAYNNRGYAYGSKSQYDQAICDYTKALELKLSAKIYDNRGYAYVIKAQYDRAISDFNNALEINPEYAQVYNNRAWAYYSEKEYDKSWEDVKKMQESGYQISPILLEVLHRTSERGK